MKVASATADGPPLVVELTGTLAAGWSAEPGYADIDDVVRFGFEEHDAAFYLDRGFFRHARIDLVLPPLEFGGLTSAGRCDRGDVSGSVSRRFWWCAG